MNSAKVTTFASLVTGCNKLSNTSVINIINMCLNATNISSNNKYLTNTSTASPFYNTKFNNSYYTEYHQALTEAGWTF